MHKAVYAIGGLLVVLFAALFVYGVEQLGPVGDRVLSNALRIEQRLPPQSVDTSKADTAAVQPSEDAAPSGVNPY